MSWKDPNVAPLWKPIREKRESLYLLMVTCQGLEIYVQNIMCCSLQTRCRLVLQTGKLLAITAKTLARYISFGKGTFWRFCVSCFIYDYDVYQTTEYGSHLEVTFANKVAIAALEVVKNENLAENAMSLGILLREELNAIDSDDFYC